MAALLCYITYRTCICGRLFVTRAPKRLQRVSCSPECLREHRREAIRAGLARTQHRVSRVRGGLRIGRDLVPPR